MHYAVMKFAGLPGEIPPDAYKSVLKVLQEDVPPQPFARIKQIIESELGLPLEDVFDEFDEQPLGAASVGQVHFARLRGQTRRVVVKVQYPEVERFFRMDFQTLKAICRLAGQAVPSSLAALEACFQQEFDYRLEAQNLRRMVYHVHAYLLDATTPS